MKNDISSGYLPVSSGSLRSDTIVGCDLYLLVETKSGRRYVLYSRGDAAFEDDDRGMLWEKNISRLFIKKDDQQKYYEYLENNFQEIITDVKIPPDERAKIVYSAATNLVTDLFNEPRAGRYWFQQLA